MGSFHRHCTRDCESVVGEATSTRGPSNCSTTNGSQSPLYSQQPQRLETPEASQFKSVEKAETIGRTEMSLPLNLHLNSQWPNDWFHRSYAYQRQLAWLQLFMCSCSQTRGTALEIMACTYNVRVVARNNNGLKTFFRQSHQPVPRRFRDMMNLVVLLDSL